MLLHSFFGISNYWLIPTLFLTNEKAVTAQLSVYLEQNLNHATIYFQNLNSIADCVREWCDLVFVSAVLFGAWQRVILHMYYSTQSFFSHATENVLSRPVLRKIETKPLEASGVLHLLLFEYLRYPSR